MKKINKEKVFNSIEYVYSYDKFRKPSSRIIIKYMKIIENLIRNLKFDSHNVLDLGCGCGHFSIDIAKMLIKNNGRLDAVDISDEMLKIFEKRCRKNKISNISIYNNDFFKIQLTKYYSLIWASDVIHIFSDLDKFISKTSTILERGGYLAIRMSSHEQLKSYEWGEFFPEALKCDLDRHHDINKIQTCLTNHGFSKIIFNEIDESRYIAKKNYWRFFENKYLSSLHYLDNKTFSKSLIEMKNNFLNNKYILRNAKTTLMVAKYL